MYNYYICCDLFCLRIVTCPVLSSRLWSLCGWGINFLKVFRRFLFLVICNREIWLLCPGVFFGQFVSHLSSWYITKSMLLTYLLKCTNSGSRSSGSEVGCLSAGCMTPRAFSTAMGWTEKIKKLIWAPRLNQWVPGKMSRESESGQHNTDHITHWVLIGL